MKFNKRLKWIQIWNKMLSTPNCNPVCGFQLQPIPTEDVYLYKQFTNTVYSFIFSSASGCCSVHIYQKPFLFSHRNEMLSHELPQSSATYAHSHPWIKSRHNKKQLWAIETHFVYIIISIMPQTHNLIYSYFEVWWESVMRHDWIWLSPRFDLIELCDVLQMPTQMKTWCCTGRAVMSPSALMIASPYHSSSSKSSTPHLAWPSTAAQVHTLLRSKSFINNVTHCSYVKHHDMNGNYFVQMNHVYHHFCLQV